MDIRVYTPWEPTQQDGASLVIKEQIAVLRALGHTVTSVSWKKPETRFERMVRVLRSIVSSAASSELYYYADCPEPEPCDLAIYHYSFAHYVLKRRREEKCIVVFHNRESLLIEARQFRARRRHAWLASALHALHAWKLRRHEEELLQMRTVWAISRADGGRFVPPVFLQPLAPAADCLHIGWIGMMDFGPNREAVLWLLDVLLPALKMAHFPGRLKLAGKTQDKVLRARIRQAELYYPLDYMGYVTEAQDFWDQVGVLLVPDREVTGVRMKLLEALVRGCPVLASPEAVSRLHPALHEQVVVCKALADWVQALEKPLRKPIFPFETITGEFIQALGAVERSVLP